MRKAIEIPVEQCAEHFALPFALRAAKKYLADGKAATVTITAVALRFRNNGEAVGIAFCQNCDARAKILAATAHGVRIFDKGSEVDLEEGEESTEVLEALVGCNVKLFCTQAMLFKTQGQNSVGGEYK